MSDSSLSKAINAYFRALNQLDHKSMPHTALKAACEAYHLDMLEKSNQFTAENDGANRNEKAGGIIELPRRQGKTIFQLKRRIIELYQQGKDAREIASTMALNYESVREVTHQFDIMKSMLEG